MIMKMIPSEALTFLLSVMLCAGCSVKEDRENCPCMLVLDFSEVDTSVVKSADLSLAADDGFVFTGELDTGDFRSGISVPVPRRDIDVRLWSGTGGMMSGDGLVIPFGEDCPPVRFHSSRVHAGDEMVRETVLLRKNHCRMTINLNNWETAPGRITVYGNVNGYMPDGTPSAGKFSCELHPDGKGGGHVILPRQLDDSLTMEINDGSGILKLFAIGEYVAETGYDWHALDLEDITVDVDVALTGITLIIQGWDEAYKFEIVI